MIVVSDESVSPSRPETESEGAAERTIAVETTWGRVTDDGVVSVREGDDWRVVGEYPDGTPEEALGYFTRKYADLAGEVTLLEQRFKRAGTSPQGLVRTARALGKKITATAAVGDLASLTARVEALSGVLAEASQEEKAAAAEALQSAIAEREAIVVSVEKLAARDPRPCSGSRPRQTSTHSSPSGRRTRTTGRACRVHSLKSSGSDSVTHAPRSRSTVASSSPVSTRRIGVRATRRPVSSSGRKR